MAGPEPEARLELRAVEPAMALPEGGVTPPIDMARAIEFYMASPILTAIGGLIAESLAGAQVDWAGGESEAEYQAIKEAWGATRWYWGGVPISWPEFVRLSVESLEATGNLFLEVAQGMVNILAPQYARYAVQGGRLILQYASPMGLTLSLPPWGEPGVERGYVHAAHRTIYHAVYGLPPWVGARDSVELDIAHRRYLQAFFWSSGTPRYLTRVWPDREAVVGEGEARLLGDALASFFRAQGGQAMHRNLVVSHPAGINVEVTPLEAKTQDPTYSTLARNVLQEILMVRHISMLHLGITEGGYRATAQEQGRMLTDYLLKPVGKLLSEAIDRALNSSPWRMEFNLDTPEATADMIEAAIKAAGVPILSPDEARALIGYEPKGDDSLWRPSSMYPEGSE